MESSLNVNNNVKSVCKTDEKQLLKIKD